jgi:hypothetical protein
MQEPDNFDLFVCSPCRLYASLVAGVPRLGKTLRFPEKNEGLLPKGLPTAEDYQRLPPLVLFDDLCHSIYACLKHVVNEVQDANP